MLNQMNFNILIFLLTKLSDTLWGVLVYFVVDVLDIF